jgi:enoyl-CoA hydratase/carnithine racemase
MSRILIERDGPITTVTLNRPEKRNALDTQMLDDLYAFFARPPEPSDRVVVIRARGHVFCAGIDLAERQRQGPTQGESPVVKVFHAIEAHPLPFVCVVQGAAIAGGCELALHCDFVVASTDARFGMSLAQIGIAPTWALAQKLLEVAGPVMTREILLLGDALPANKMAELGIIGRAVAPEMLEESAARVIQRLARNAPLSLRAMKALINREMAFRDGIGHDDVDALVQQARESNDAKEGIAAKLEKRPPEFSGT